MLAHLLAEDLRPGSNVAQRAGSDSWVHLLPSLELRCVVSIEGHPAASVTASAARSVHLVSVEDLPADLPRSADGDVSLITITEPALRRVVASTALVTALRSIVGPETTVVVTATGRSGRRTGHLVTALLDRDAAATVVLGRGAPRGADRAADADRLVVPDVRPPNTAPVVVRRARTALRVLGARYARLGRAGGRRVTTHASDLVVLHPDRVARHTWRSSGAAMVVPPAGRDAARPPRWLEQIGVAAGEDWSRATWSFAPPRGYRSQKPLFLVGTSAGEAPWWVVKTTQDPRFNAKLDTEADALRRLVDDRLVPPATVPSLVLRTHHGGRSVVVETVLPGRPFRHHSTGRPDCPVAARAVAWFTALGERTADRRPEHGERLVCGARVLTDRYVAAFAPTDGHRRSLDGLVDDLVDAAVPAVFFHGDPGNWNLLVGEDGTIGVLDWENATPVGPPLWDLLLFLRTYGILVGETGGRRATVATFVEQFRPGSAFRSLVDPAVTDYARRLRLGTEVLEALTVLCWVHQALKEASRTPPTTTRPGTWRGIVERSLDDPALYRAPSPR